MQHSLKNHGSVFEARLTSIKIVQQVAILIGCAVLPHLRSLVEIIEHGVNDENKKVIQLLHSRWLLFLTGLRALTWF